MPEQDRCVWKRRVFRYAFVIVTCLMILLFVAVWPIFRVFWSFDHLEQNAKRVITGSQLQAWAISVLEHPPTNITYRISELGTNFPPQLLGLYHYPPTIDIYEATTDSPGSVILTWGGGLIGHCGFVVGPTNFVDYHLNAHAWQDGVYFWTDQSKK